MFGAREPGLLPHYAHHFTRPRDSSRDQIRVPRDLSRDHIRVPRDRIKLALPYHVTIPAPHWRVPLVRFSEWYNPPKLEIPRDQGAVLR